MFDVLERLVNANGVSGDETAARKILLECCEGAEVDKMGNVIMRKRREGAKRVVVCAHMDEVGLIVSNITAEGYLKFKAIGGIDAAILPAKQVTVGARGVRGVIAVRPKHLVKKSDSAVAKIEEMFIDIGARDRAEAMGSVQVGDYAAFVGDYEEMSGGVIKGKAMDDRVGCVIMLELMKHEFPYDMSYMFTVQEEVGCRGALALAGMDSVDLVVVLEGTMCADLPNAADDKAVTRMGNGPALSIMDGVCIYDRDVNASLREYAEEKGIKVQWKAAFVGGNDAGKLHTKDGGIPTVAVNVPCRYIHSPHSVVDKGDIEASFELLKGWLESGKI